jgi:hypothetical protein
VEATVRAEMISASENSILSFIPRLGSSRATTLILKFLAVLKACFMKFSISCARMWYASVKALVPKA